MEDDNAAASLPVLLYPSEQEEESTPSRTSRRSRSTIITTFSLYSQECIQQLQNALQLLELKDKNQTATLQQQQQSSASRFHTINHISDSEDDDNDEFSLGSQNANHHHNNDNEDSDDDSNQDTSSDFMSNEEEVDDHLQPLSISTTNGVSNTSIGITHTVQQSSSSSSSSSSVSNLNPTNTTTTTTMKPPKVSNFHPSIIRKHIDTISTISFDIPNTQMIPNTNTNTIIIDPKHDTSTTTNTSHRQTEQLLQQQHTIEFPTCLLSKEQIQSDSIIEQCRSYYHLATSIQSPSSQSPIIIVLIQSGRLAGAVFQPSNNNSTHPHYPHSPPKQNHHSILTSSTASMHCTHHRTSVRYTVRKGQGKSQSSQDAQGRKAISIGSQLRRQGEIQLREDIQRMIQDWKELFQSAALILISVPRTMQKDLFDHHNNNHHGTTAAILQRHDPRIRRIPLDVGRPTFENVCLIYQILMTVTIREYHYYNKEEVSSTSRKNNNNTTTSIAMIQTNDNSNIQSKGMKGKGDAKDNNNDHKDEEAEDVIVPLSVLHIAAQNGDVATLESLLDDHNNDDDDDDNKESTLVNPDDVPVSILIDQPAGIEQMTPLHYAAASCSISNNHNPSVVVDPNHAASCVRLLLERGHANPCIVDQRRRVPYTLAVSQNDKVRDAFRISRAILGEDYCDWDNAAKVGTPLSLDELNDKLEKEAEKRRKKRLKQKEKKAKEKVEEQAAEERRLALEEQRKKDEDAKRIRDGLQPKKVITTPGGKACDFCQTICVGKKRINMFQRLEYSYCTSECLQNHKRELMATAAMARMNQ